MKTVKQGD